MYKVCVIVPVYNCETYIKRCINSIQNQTLKEIKIIAINDGSTDGSLEILQKINKADKRLLIINKSNGGVSSARNAGIDAADGNYISFVDADDYIESNMLEILYNTAIEEDSDILSCGSKYICNAKINGGSGFNHRYIFNLENEFNKFIKYYLNPNYRTSCWNKMYKLKMIKENSCRFIDYKEVVSEDKLFNFQCLVFSRIISIVPDRLYNYEVRDGSLSHARKYYKTARRNTNLINYMIKYVNTSNNIKFDNLLLHYYIETFNVLASLEAYHNKSENKNVVTFIKEYFNNTQPERIRLKSSITSGYKIQLNEISKQLYYQFLVFCLNNNLNSLFIYLIFIKSKFRFIR